MITDWRAENRSNGHLLQKKLYIFDQDGTIYLDFHVLPGVKEFLDFLVAKNLKFVFLTNNSSRSTTTYKDRLGTILDLKLSSEHVYTSTQATIQYLKRKGIGRVCPIGTPDFEEELLENGVVLDYVEPEMIVLSFDTTLTYKKLENACYLIQRGVEYIATHPDMICPTKDGYIPDIGSFMALIEGATGAKPRKILGKPNREMVEFLLKKYDLKKEEAIIFGDRLYTDIRMGKYSGITTALMLTGESKIEDIKEYAVVPDFVFENFQEVLELLGAQDR